MSQPLALSGSYLGGSYLGYPYLFGIADAQVLVGFLSQLAAAVRS